MPMSPPGLECNGTQEGPLSGSLSLCFPKLLHGLRHLSPCRFLSSTVLCARYGFCDSCDQGTNGDSDANKLPTSARWDEGQNPKSPFIWRYGDHRANGEG